MSAAHAKKVVHIRVKANLEGGQVRMWFCVIDSSGNIFILCISTSLPVYHVSLAHKCLASMEYTVVVDDGHLAHLEAHFERKSREARSMGMRRQSGERIVIAMRPLARTRHPLFAADDRQQRRQVGIEQVHIFRIQMIQGRSVIVVVAKSAQIAVLVRLKDCC